MEEEESASERSVQEQIQIAASKHGHRLWRNNSGAFKDESGRWVYFGLGNVSKKHNAEIKSSDLIGFTMVKITKQMVGMELPIFTATEVKESKWTFKETAREIAQDKFLNIVKVKNGIASFANSVESYLESIISYKPR